jgi:hypothetical protein
MKGPNGLRFTCKSLRFTCNFALQLNRRLRGRGAHFWSTIYLQSTMDSLRTHNLDVRHPITPEVILNVFDKRLLVPSQPLGIVA